MSDDTPTQRYPEGFPPPGGAAPDGTPPAATDPLADAPTERFVAPADPQAGAPIPVADVAPPAGTVPPTPPTSGSDDGGDKRGNRGLIVTLAIVAGVLLLALIGVLIWIAVNSGRPQVTPTGSPTPSVTPSESPEPSPTPTPTETETTPPTPPQPVNVITSYTSSTQTVDCTASGGTSIPVTFSWATTGVTLWFGVGTDDAHADPYGDFPLNYTMDFDYQCGQQGGQQRYTITVQRSDGSFQSQTIVVREV